MENNTSVSTEISITTSTQCFEKSFHDFDINGYETIVIHQIDSLLDLSKMVKLDDIEFSFNQIENNINEDLKMNYTNEDELQIFLIEDIMNENFVHERWIDIEYSCGRIEIIMKEDLKIEKEIEKEKCIGELVEIIHELGKMILQ